MRSQVTVTWGEPSTYRFDLEEVQPMPHDLARTWLDEQFTDMPEEQWVAELVREQLLAVTRDELPYSIATRVTEWEWPRVRCEIIVERESQKGMVIGKSGQLLKKVGIEARKQMPDGAFLELFVVVDKDWQHRAERVERLGY